MGILGKILKTLRPPQESKKVELAGFYQPQEGWAWNPLRAHRNIPCLCGSGFKAKLCHGRLDVLPHDTATKIAAALKHQGL